MTYYFCQTNNAISQSKADITIHHNNKDKEDMSQPNLDNVNKINIRGGHINQNKLYLNEESSGQMKRITDFFQSGTKTLVACKLFN